MPLPMFFILISPPETGLNKLKPFQTKRKTGAENLIFSLLCVMLCTLELRSFCSIWSKKTELNLSCGKLDSVLSVSIRCVK